MDIYFIFNQIHLLSESNLSTNEASLEITSTDALTFKYQGKIMEIYLYLLLNRTLYKKYNDS